MERVGKLSIERSMRRSDSSVSVIALPLSNASTISAGEWVLSTELAEILGDISRWEKEDES